MSHHDPVSPDNVHDSDALPSSARPLLDEIARALNITTALPSAVAEAGSPDGSGLAPLAQASLLLQAFINLSDPEARRRCLDFVREEAAKEQVRD